MEQNAEHVPPFSHVNHAIEECWNEGGTLGSVTNAGSMTDSDWPGRLKRPPIRANGPTA